MAQNSLLEKIEQLKNSQKVKQTTPEQQQLAQQAYARTQPLYGQGGIRGLTSSERRKLRWSNIKDAGKGALSSIYGAATFIPETLARIGTAGVDQVAGTDTQSKLDEIASYIPNKLRNNSSNTKAFDKGQKYTDDALMAAALLTAGASGPRGAGGPKAQLKDLAKNPTKYNPVEAGNIVRSAEAAGVEPVKVGGVKLTPRQIYSKYNQNFDTRLSDWELKNFTKYSETPAYQQKLWSEYNAAKNGNIMDTYSDIPSHEFKTYKSDSVVGVHGNNGATRMPTMKELNTLYRELSPEEIANMKQYIAKDISDYLGLESEYESLGDVSYETAKKLLKDYNEYRANIEKNNTSRARANATKKRNMSAKERAAREADEESFAIESLISDDVYPIRVKDVQERLNTSRARANATKKRNMSAKERAARERAEDSANELAADRLRNEAGNMSLEDMYKLWKSQQNG